SGDDDRNNRLVWRGERPYAGGCPPAWTNLADQDTLLQPGETPMPRMVLLAIAATLFVVSAGRTEERYDLLIRDGRIVDGTGNPWFRGDAPARGGKIVAVGRVPEAAAQRQIDAKGLIVTPGFIDMHSHSDYLLLEDGDAQSKIRQGVTTEVLGEGTSAGP